MYQFFFINIASRTSRSIFTYNIKMSRSRGRHYGQRRGKPLRVLVDMDGVLCDFEGQVLKLFREKYPNEPFIPTEDRKTFSVEKQYRSVDENLGPKVREIWEGEGFFRNLKPLEGAIEAIKEMSGLDNVEVFICTSPLTAPTLENHFSAKEKFEWVEHHLGNDWVKRMVVTGDKTIVMGDILIDDKAKITGIEPCPPWEQILFTSPQNKAFDIKTLNNCSARLDNWTDTSKWKSIIDQYKKKIA